jgi:hypothetical protein
MSLPAGAVVTVHLSGEASAPSTADDLRGELAAALAESFLVRSITIDHHDLLSSIAALEWIHWNFTATIVVETETDHFDSPAIVGMTVGWAVQRVTGATPSGIVATAGGADIMPSLPASPGSVIGDWANALHTDARALTIALVVLVGLALYLIAFGPNVGSIAKVL